MAGLTIYKASAGSGKTFRLTGEYLLLLFGDPGLYRHILAVTFTNKATAEMKNRILQELGRLSRGDASPYRQMLRDHFSLKESTINARAGELLHNILHDYSRFSVSTIDHFFQKVLRSFAREIGLQTGYTLETDHDEILKFVVDELILATEQDRQLRDWLVDLAESRMMEGKSWDSFRREMVSLAGELTREEVKALRLGQDDTLNDPDELRAYVEHLKKEKARYENTLYHYGRQALEVIEQNGLTIDDFSYGKSGGVGQYFIYLRNRRYDKYPPGARVLGVLDQPEEWAKKKGTDQQTQQLVQQLARDPLNDLLSQAVATVNRWHRYYLSIREVLANIHVLGILGDIQKRINRYCREQNIFLISDSGDMLRRIIAGNDAPFVYEKTGNRYHHFMIDEFQDTSRFQWDNFRPLLHNSLAQEHYNLMVGDVKQSIYRWRNGDWKILQDEVQQHFPAAEAVSLDMNWRSRYNVVAYNNTLFYHAPGIMQGQYDRDTGEAGLDNPFPGKLEEAYRDVLQKMPQDKSGGYVFNRFFEYTHPNESRAKEQIRERLIGDIRLLQDKGYRLADIAVLVRTNKEGKEIADALTWYQKHGDAGDSYRYDFVSSDLLYIEKAESVRLICALFRYLVKPDDVINQAFIKDTYRHFILQEQAGEGELHELFRHDPTNWAEYLPEAFTRHIEELRRMPLYELTERLIRIFSIYSLQDELPYIQAFQEVILDFSRRYASDLNTFLDWWGENSGKKSLQLPEDYDAIRITTIHKAKGLQYKAVLVPYCNWPLNSSGAKRSYIWHQPGQEPFNQLKVVPLKYTKELEKSDFYEPYHREKFHQYVDALNMLYVAFTRAEEVLIPYVPLQVSKSGRVSYKEDKKDRNKGIGHIGELIHFIYENHAAKPKPQDQQAPFIHQLQDYWDNENKTFSYGSLAQPAEESAGEEQKFPQTHYPVWQSKPALRLRYEHGAFFGEDQDPGAPRTATGYGQMMHQVFENIHTTDDIDPALDKIYLEGKIDSGEKATLKAKILEEIRQTGVEEWFSGSWQVYNEREILLPNGGSDRPDRVMFKDGQTVVIDYKFGERADEKYRRQMGYYMKDLKNMGYPQPVGYIWYINQQELIRV